MIQKILRLTMLLFIFHYALIAQDKNENELKDYSNCYMFSSKIPLSIELYLDKKALLRDVGDDRKYHPAVIKYLTQENNQIELKVKIQTRGNFRRNPENCNMAPLSFKISRNPAFADSIFSGQKKLKLVVPCRQENEKFQEYVILEYLIYQTFELLSDIGYKTRLVDVILIDSLKTDKIMNFTGFFIEETDQMAQRNKGVVKEFKRYHPENVDREQMTLVNVFQYLIGNTDWSVEVGHNIKLLFQDNKSIPYAVPYDFDWSGIISPPYAKPAPQLEISHVQERLFRGYFREQEEYTPIIKLFNDKKEEIYNLYKNCNKLSEKTRNSAIKYIDEFYEIINNPKMVKREFIDNCRKG